MTITIPPSAALPAGPTKRLKRTMLSREEHDRSRYPQGGSLKLDRDVLTKRVGTSLYATWTDGDRILCPPLARTVSTPNFYNPPDEGEDAQNVRSGAMVRSSNGSPERHSSLAERLLQSLTLRGVWRHRSVRHLTLDPVAPSTWPSTVVALDDQVAWDCGNVFEQRDHLQRWLALDGYTTLWLLPDAPVKPARHARIQWVPDDQSPLIREETGASCHHCRHAPPSLTLDTIFTVCQALTFSLAHSFSSGPHRALFIGASLPPLLMACYLRYRRSHLSALEALQFILDSGLSYQFRQTLSSRLGTKDSRQEAFPSMQPAYARRLCLYFDQLADYRRMPTASTFLLHSSALSLRLPEDAPSTLTVRADIFQEGQLVFSAGANILSTTAGKQRVALHGSVTSLRGNVQFVVHLYEEGRVRLCQRMSANTSFLAVGQSAFPPNHFDVCVSDPPYTDVKMTLHLELQCAAPTVVMSHVTDAAELSDPGVSELLVSYSKLSSVPCSETALASLMDQGCPKSAGMFGCASDPASPFAQD